MTYQLLDYWNVPSFIKLFKYGCAVILAPDYTITLSVINHQCNFLGEKTTASAQNFRQFCAGMRKKKERDILQF